MAWSHIRGPLLQASAAAAVVYSQSAYGSGLVQEYFLMALSQPRSQAHRASKHMRVASVTPANRAASVTAGMQPRNLQLLHEAHAKEQAERGEKLQKAPAPKGVLRTIKPIASSVASVGPRMVKFRSNIQYLGEKVSVLCEVSTRGCSCCTCTRASVHIAHVSKPSCALGVGDD